MNHRQRTLAILSYQSYDRLPLVHFGFWTQTLEKWAEEGHISMRLAHNWRDGNAADAQISACLGFDFNWSSAFSWDTGLRPPLRRKILQKLPDGSHKVLNEDGAIVIEKPGIVSIPSEVGHLLEDRAAWEKIFLPRLQFDMERITRAWVYDEDTSRMFCDGGRELILNPGRALPYGLYCGSLIGAVRNWLGVVNFSYVQYDDPELFAEIVNTVGELCYQGVKTILDTGLTFDYGHFWEDICFKNGPLLNPKTFARLVAPHYGRITGLLREHGIDLVSVDCDGKIDQLVPLWLEHGVNVMFPIEVGTWNASIAPWRDRYGKGLRGVGGMNKTVFAQDYAAVDAEVERLRSLVDLGGFIPCPDHRIPPDAKWENVQYYCDRMRRIYS
jgi:uroporphyrinogen decarboxylase